MSNNPGVFTKNNAEGIERVKETDGKYAFFMESAAIEYAVENACGELQRWNKSKHLHKRIFLGPKKFTRKVRDSRQIQYQKG